MKPIKEIWFDERFLYGKDEDGKVYRQSLLWYDSLRKASDSHRCDYHIGFEGIHWPELDVDVSFDSFAYKDAEPTAFQEFFLTHKEINMAGFSEYVGINPTLLRNYINGFKHPSVARLKEIQNALKSLAETYSKVNFVE